MHLRSRYETIYFKHCHKYHTQQSTFFWCRICYNVIGTGLRLFCSSDLKIHDQTDFFWKQVRNLKLKPTKVQFLQGLFNLFFNLFESFLKILVSFLFHVQQLNINSLPITAHCICRRHQASNISVSQKVISKQRPQVQLRWSIRLFS